VTVAPVRDLLELRDDDRVDPVIRTKGASQRQGSEHALDASREEEKVSRSVRVDCADRVGEIDGADDFVQRVVRDIEVAAPDSGRVALEPLTEPRNTLLIVRVASSRSSESRMRASWTRLARALAPS
jgi:hypothetical protein